MRRGPRRRGGRRESKGPRWGAAPRPGSSRRGAWMPWGRLSPGSPRWRPRPRRRLGWRRRRRRPGGRLLTAANCPLVWMPWWQPPLTWGTCLALAPWTLSPPPSLGHPAQHPHPVAQGFMESPCSASWLTWRRSSSGWSRPCKVSPSPPAAGAGPLGTGSGCASQPGAFSPARLSPQYGPCQETGGRGAHTVSPIALAAGWAVRAGPHAHLTVAAGGGTTPVAVGIPDALGAQGCHRFTRRMPRPTGDWAGGAAGKG